MANVEILGFIMLRAGLCVVVFQGSTREATMNGMKEIGLVGAREELCCNVGGKSLGKRRWVLKMSRVKLPDKSKWFPMFETECRNECLNNCTCMAYAYYGGVGCMMWDEGLIDAQKSTSYGADLYIRLADSELGNKKNQKAIIATTVVLGRFEPISNGEWDEGNWTMLQCGRKIFGGKEDGFLKMSRVKLPDKSKWFPMFETECRNECLNNCTCMAYAYYDGVGCMMWDEGLIDVQKFTSDGADLYIRLADSELGKEILMEPHMPNLGITIKLRRV
ncbi:hypothetical protein BUALT_Bualt18G0104300 [Buddleja alternifolia]|uniref:Apple domain-containing protein n=1 Tax=Buddleja alternifolia TaxID=168488 RepID=A0AAV6WDN4_9LAMI|nr:hypothetical protein BUALT_Bualt18G0104300 [Buddleja alternifolia]